MFAATSSIGISIVAWWASAFGDVDIGLAMAKAGLAEAMLRYLPATHSISEVEYGQAENRARDSGFGMWSAEIESPHEYRRSKSSRIP
ncbi:nuclease-like protein [Sinorhizobium medicae]|nr:thermonuclease family protein [Sinorhizobium medicae]TWA12843.1 nuclease-like protein [Sinorhizobium medicae]TWA33932.1 nuclease-like protein [Sinorhizobium medicae]